MSSEKPILHSYFRSSCSWRVRTCLNWKEIDYEYCPVNLLERAQKKEEYSETNPKVVPALKTDGILLSQSVAILEYLEETQPEKPLLPKDPYKRALVRSIVQAIASDIQPLIQPLHYIKSLQYLESIGGNKNEYIIYCITHGFEGIERQLANTSGKYCVGDEVTLADVCLLPQVYDTNRFGIDMTKFPLIQRITNDLSELDAFKKGHPQNQIDCPAEEKNKIS